MNTYNIPRNVKGEGRILFVFSTKALIYTVCGAILGSLFYLLLNLIGFKMLGIFFIIGFGFIGFVIGTFKVPDTSAFKITKKTGGSDIDDVIKRYIKFKMQKNKIYIYDRDNTEEKYKQKEKEVKTKEEGGI